VTLWFQKGHNALTSTPLLLQVSDCLCNKVIKDTKARA
jgi:hypothetical protein